MKIELLIAALRDTANKAAETGTHKETRFKDNSYVHSFREEREEVDVTEERYSKEWIAGRLHGMADTLEALTGAASQTEGE